MELKLPFAPLAKAKGALKLYESYKDDKHHKVFFEGYMCGIVNGVVSNCKGFDCDINKRDEDILRDFIAWAEKEDKSED